MQTEAFKEKLWLSSPTMHGDELRYVTDAIVKNWVVIFKKGRGGYLITLAPLFGHIMSLILSTGWSDFRYFWPLNLMNMALILLALVVANSTDHMQKM